MSVVWVCLGVWGGGGCPRKCRRFLRNPICPPSPPTPPTIPPRPEYAKVLKMLGNGRLEAHCYDGVQRLCHIRGKMRKQVWVAVVSGTPLGLTPRARPLAHRHRSLLLESESPSCCRCSSAPCPPSQGDIVLVSLREYQDCKADVIMKYTAEEARELKKRKWLPDNGAWRSPCTTCVGLRAVASLKACWLCPAPFAPDLPPPPPAPAPAPALLTLSHTLSLCTRTPLPCTRACPLAVKINDPTAEGDAGADGDGKASFEFADFDEVRLRTATWPHTHTPAHTPAPPAHPTPPLSSSTPPPPFPLELLLIDTSPSSCDGLQVDVDEI